MRDQQTVVVIGAGIGGLAAAARLARSGFRVTVLEKNGRPGGRCDRLTSGGHVFDTGPTLFLMPAQIAETFAALGERLGDHLDLRRVDPTYRLHFLDGTRLQLTADLDAMKSQLEAIETRSFEGYLRYLDEGKTHFDMALQRVVGRDFRSFPEYFNAANLRLLVTINALRRHYTHVGRYFSDDRLKAAFTFQDMYLGLNPFHAPATYSLLQYSELADGVWYPMGGMYRLVEALAGIARDSGVRFIFNAPVSSISTEASRATGVTLEDGQHFPAGIVIANADLPYVYRHLLPGSNMNRRLARMRYSCSAVMFYWGVSRRVDQLGPHNLFFAGDYRTSFDAIFRDFTCPDDPGFYVHAPARTDPSLAPPGQDTLIVAVPVGHIDERVNQDWEAIKSQARQSVLRRLARAGIRGLEDAIQFEETLTPGDWQTRYNLARGASHSFQHSLLQVGYLRPRNQHARYDNLYFVGAGTHPGTGIPSVLMSAQHVTARIVARAGLPVPVTATADGGWDTELAAIHPLAHLRS